VSEVRPNRATIRDIAAGAKVSVATVSRVLNGRPDVSENTRERVLEQVRLQGYVLNRAARSVAGGQTGLIGLVMPFLNSDYFARVAAGASEYLYEHDSRFVLCATQHSKDREISLLDRVMHGTTDGAFLVLPAESSAELKHLRDEGYPFVVVDPMVPLDEDVPVVTAAHFAGARAAVDHLIGLGHERIAAITGVRDWLASRDRLTGYQSALFSAGLPVRREYVLEGAYTIDTGYKAAVRLLSLDEPPTAIFAFNDNMAVGALQAAREQGVRVPKHLSIVGFDDLEVAALSTPALTTVRQPLEEMGRIASSLLLRLIEEQPLDAGHIELSTRLVVRESTAPPAVREDLRTA
jgi:LacI family transcriptional regulator